MSATSVGRHVVFNASATGKELESLTGAKQDPLAGRKGDENARIAAVKAANAQNGGQPAVPPDKTRDDAMAALVAAIPAEGFAAYLAIYALVIALFLDSTGEPFAWAAYGAVVLGAAINVFALIWSAATQWRTTPPEDAGAARLSLFWRIVSLTVLYLIVVIATPDNPFVKFGELNIGVGLIAVVVAGSLLGITKKI